MTLVVYKVGTVSTTSYPEALKLSEKLNEPIVKQYVSVKELPTDTKQYNTNQK